ncbi:MAG: hypothetical protein ACRDTW_00960 [Rhodococcus qingshengii]
MEVITQVSALCDDLVETEQIKAREHTPDEVLSAGRPYLAVVKGEELSNSAGHGVVARSASSLSERVRRTHRACRDGRLLVLSKVAASKASAPRQSPHRESDASRPHPGVVTCAARAAELVAGGNDDAAAHSLRLTRFRATSVLLDVLARYPGREEQAYPAH